MEFQKITKENRGIAVDAVFRVNRSVFNYRVAGVWIENGHVLLHKMVGDEHWSLPGGRVRMMEDSKTSLKREISEELGIQVNVNQLLWIVENFFEYNRENYHELGLYYKVTAENGAAYFKEGDFYGTEGNRLIFRWVPLNQLEEIPLYPLFLRKELKNLPYSTQYIIARQ
jgi:ADP-ribose pyrophosphatase YjhB (NUDIX family)